MSPQEQRAIQRAINKARKRLPFLPEKKQNAMLEWAAGSLAEAYRIGAEEAQREIVGPLLAMVPLQTDTTGR